MRRVNKLKADVEVISNVGLLILQIVHVYIINVELGS